MGGGGESRTAFYSEGIKVGWKKKKEETTSTNREAAAAGTGLPTLPCPPWGSTGLCIGGVWADCTPPDWLMESERDWMAVSDTVVQILGEPCLLSLLRSSTWWTRRERRG